MEENPLNLLHPAGTEPTGPSPDPFDGTAATTAPPVEDADVAAAAETTMRGLLSAMATRAGGSQWRGGTAVQPSEEIGASDRADDAIEIAGSTKIEAVAGRPPAPAWPS